MSNGYVDRATMLFSRRGVEPEDNHVIHSMRQVMEEKANSLRRPNVEVVQESEKPPTQQMTLEQLNDKYWELNISLSNATHIINKLTHEKDKLTDELQTTNDKVIRMKANYDQLTSQHCSLVKSVNTLVRQFNTLTDEHNEIEKVLDELESKQPVIEGDVKQLKEAYNAQIPINDEVNSIAQKITILDADINKELAKHAKQINLQEDKLYEFMNKVDAKTTKHDEDIFNLQIDVEYTGE